METTSRPALAPESDSAVGPLPLPAPTTATPSVDKQEKEHTPEGLSLTMTMKTSTTVAAAAAAATAKIPFSVPLRFVAAVPPLLLSEDLMRGEGCVLRDVEAG